MNTIKNKMEQRTIQPSSDSWDRLEQMLDNADESVKRTSYIKYVVAASIVLILGITAVLQLNSEKEVVNPILVKENSNKVLKEETQIVEEVFQKIEPKEELSEIAQKEPEIVIRKQEKLIAKKEEEPKSSLVVNEKEKEAKIAQIKEELKTLLLASIQDSLLEEQQPKNIDDEVDDLLAQAMKDVEDKEQYAYNRMADAETLLADIEEELDLFSDEEYLLAEAQGELDESIKEKVYQILKNNYKRVRASMANRNY